MGSSEYHKSTLHFENENDSYRLLEVSSGFRAMKIAHESLPSEESNDEWKVIAIWEMMETNLLKYRACPHAKAVLLDSKAVLAEATSDKFWGSGLNPEMTRTTLSDYWPGKNNLGKVLVRIWEDFINDEMAAMENDIPGTPGSKRKAVSPLVSQHKLVKQ